MITIRPLDGQANIELLPDLCGLLTDSVNGGASVGFLAPLASSAAAEYWRDTFGSIGPGLVVWVAEEQGRVVGSVQLALCGKENGKHRAEVQKLFVLGDCRGRGIASRLMAALESFAVQAGRTLLVLDTQKGSAAETVYRKLGWSMAGEIPDFAAAPDGRLKATVLYFKQLG